MTSFKGLPQAEAGSNESQDSQAILEAYKAEFGVPTVASSLLAVAAPCLPNGGETAGEQAISETPEASPRPLPEEKPGNGNAPAETRSAYAGPAAEQTYAREPMHGEAAPNNPDPKCDTPANLVSSTGLGPAPNSRTCEQSGAVTVEESMARHDFQQHSISVRDHAINDESQSLPLAAVASLKKMDYSQQSPTQVNDDRDYSEYNDIVPSSPTKANTPHTSNEPRTLETDDTGAVNFGNLSELGRPSSQVSEDGGFENTTRGEWRLPDGTSQQLSSNAFTPYKPRVPAFETPALPKNPFAAKSTIAAPLAGSQLFGQTQFSSAIKKISPTSSRPSPNHFYPVSDNIIETSPLKDRANVSSPTDIRTSSPPHRLREIPNTSSREQNGEPEEAETPLNSRSTGADVIPESPPSSENTPRALPPRSSGNGPLAHYEPIKKSQERKNEESLIPSLDPDEDSDDAIRKMERRRRIQRKRAQAAEELERISYTPKVGRNSGELPGRKRRRLDSDPPPSSRIDPGNEIQQETIPLVNDSQKEMVPSNETLPDTLPFESTKATPGEDTMELEPMEMVGDEPMHIDTEKIPQEEDRIPATSPLGSYPSTLPPEPPAPPEPELPTTVEDPRSSVPGESEVSSSEPLMARRNLRTYGRASRARRRNPFLSSSDAVTAEDAGKVNVPSSPPNDDPVETPRAAAPKVALEGIEEHNEQQAEGNPQAQTSAPEVVVPMTTRSKRSDANPITPLTKRSPGPMLPTSSSLSILSQTPNPSANTTPGTQNSPTTDKPESVSLPSPHKRTLRTTTKSESPQPVTRPSRLSKRGPRIDSDSTDELCYSPAASVMEKSLVHSRSIRSFRQSLGPAYRATRLFEGMVFAISLQNQVKQQERNKLESKITQAGGAILQEGFQEMFEHSAIMSTVSPIIDDEDTLKLNRASADVGFAAVIADSHSRKAKYMQALALGIPCLAQQWINACLNKGAIVDWDPYLLCAGSSAVLGDAIRSRSLAHYAAADARFATVIAQRPRLLAGQRVLMVVDSKRSRSEAKEPYMFLAALLGPTSISRVFTTAQARDVIAEHQKAGTPFDWLYIDKGTGTPDAVLSLSEPVATTTRGKKGRRTMAPGWAPVRTSNVRVLDDELVIQSLILGRMVEEDEMSF